jgi:hypothetical protein
MQVQPFRGKSHEWYTSPTGSEWPRKRFPDYATGLGYAISAKFASCAKEKLKSVLRFMAWEDVATGILALRCNITLTEANNWSLASLDFPYEQLKNGGVPAHMVHKVTPENMLKLHSQEPVDRPLADAYRADSFTLYNQTHNFRFSPELLRSRRIQPNDDAPRMAFGIVSHPNQPDRRNAVRNSWAFDERAIFIVAGAWDDAIAREFRLGDILWLNATEDYRSGLTLKTMAFLHYCASQLVGSIDYCFKTDDDVYVNATQIRYELRTVIPARSSNQIDYYGLAHVHTEPIRNITHKWYTSPNEWPRKRFPNYAAGLGYAVSAKFASCAKESMKSLLRFMPWEDVATGLLARKCDILITLANWMDSFVEENGKLDFPYNRFQNGGVPAYMVHKVTPQNMLKLHRQEPL